MKISEIQIKNIMAIEDLRIVPGSLTLIEGRNGVGKTSVLAAIRALLAAPRKGKGYVHDPQLIRKGAESGEVSLTLDDGVQFHLLVTPSRSTRIARHPKFGRIEFDESIEPLVDRMSVDPISFLVAPAEARLKMFLQAMPLQVTADQLGFLPVNLLEVADLDGHALEVLGKIHKSLYDERTGVNRVVKDKAATARQMRESLPENPPEGDWKTTYESARDQSSRLQVEVRHLVDAEKEQCLHAKERIEQNLQDAIQEAAAKLRQEADAEKLAVEQERDQKLEALKAQHGPRLAELMAKMTQAQTMLAQSERAEGARKAVRSLEAEAGELDKQSRRLSEALEKLDKLEALLLEKTPIRGVEIHDGDIYVEGIPFDKVNEARRIQIALEVARLRAGELPLVLVDDAEHFDTINKEKLRNAAAKAGLQIVAACVADGDLRVEGEGVPNVA